MRRALAALLLVLGGCVANTPQQELAYTRWARCNHPFLQLERIEIDGRIVFQYRDSAGRNDVLRCLAEAGVAGPALPAPLAVRPPGGP